MPLPPSPLLRFARFARRFAPLWLVWLLIAALPPAREGLRLQLLGSPLAPTLNLIGREDLRPDQRFDSFKIAAQYPANLNARLWRFSQMLDSLGAGFDKLGDQNRRIYRPNELRAEAYAIRAAFPQRKWLVSLPLRVASAGLAAAAKPAKTETGTVKTARQELLRHLQSAARAEPGNALYPLLEAGIWRANHDQGAMRAALSRASQCAVLDEHELEWTRAMVRAHEMARPLILEEKTALSTGGVPWWQDGVLSPSFLAHEARLAQRAGDHRRALEIGVMMLQIGDLMQRRPNSLFTAENGREWKSQAWTLNYRTLPVFQNYPTRIRRKATLWAASFSAYAAAHGRPDVAALNKKWQMRQTQIGQLTGVYNPRASAPPQPPRDALWWAEFWRNADIFVGAQLLYVAAFWMLVNLILWRGVGAPSTSRERLVPSLWLAFGSAALAWWCWRQIDLIIAARWSPKLDHFAFAIASAALLAFFGPPFLLALGSATSVLWTRRAEFFKPARIETEMRLSRSQSVLLRAGPTILAAAGLLATLGVWLLWLGLVAFDVTTLDPFGWLSASSLGAQPVEWLIAPLLYCLFLDGLGFLGWFNKWRYYAGRESRPLTHGALRRWKETLSIYIVLGSLIYGGVALWSWPARAAANRQLETRMVRGELPP